MSSESDSIISLHEKRHKDRERVRKKEKKNEKEGKKERSKERFFFVKREKFQSARCAQRRTCLSLTLGHRESCMQELQVLYSHKHSFLSLQVMSSKPCPPAEERKKERES